VAGYSGTPLAAKLGIKSGNQVLLLYAPDSFELEVPDGASTDRGPEAGQPPDVVLAFFTRLSELEQEIDALASTIFPAGSLWLAWPKKASRVESDLSDNHVRACALERGLVDNKVCALDETWSALRVVWRKELRPARPQTRRGHR
jgi:hypothetical protein